MSRLKSQEEISFLILEENQNLLLEEIQILFLEEILGIFKKMSNKIIEKIKIHQLILKEVSPLSLEGDINIFDY